MPKRTNDQSKGLALVLVLIQLLLMLNVRFNVGLNATATFSNNSAERISDRTPVVL